MAEREAALKAASEHAARAEKAAAERQDRLEQLHAQHEAERQELLRRLAERTAAARP